LNDDDALALSLLPTSSPALRRYHGRDDRFGADFFVTPLRGQELALNFSASEVF